MNHQNYVRKCEEYLQNIPATGQKRNADSGRRPITAVGAGQYPSSRKLTQPASSIIGQRRLEKQPINNAVAGSGVTGYSPLTGKGRQRPLPPGTNIGSSAEGGQKQTERQSGSKFVRSCCRQLRPSTASAAGKDRNPRDNQGREKVTDSVNQADNIKPMESDADYDGAVNLGTDAEIPQSERSGGAVAEIWSGILQPTPAASVIEKSVPIAAFPTRRTSLSSSSRPTSSVAAIPPQPRPSVATLTPGQQQRQNGRRSPTLEGINLFHFDPLRTLQFLTLELKSKLKEHCPEHKQLYKISKELLYALKILTESLTSDGPPKKSPASCANCEKALLRVSCRDVAIQSTEIPPAEPLESVTNQKQQQLQQEEHLEREIERLQALINDKQTAEGGLIADLNRKLQEATSRCHRLSQAREDAEKRLLYTTLENERLNFLVSTQSSTMTSLRSDFSSIQTLANQQIDLLDRTRSPTPPSALDGIDSVRSTTWPKKANASTNNHHRNYRHPSGGIPRILSLHYSEPNCAINSTVTAERQQKLASGPVNARKLRHHYSFKNIAEKESDDGNDANDSKLLNEGITPAFDGVKTHSNDYRRQQRCHQGSGFSDSADAFHQQEPGRNRQPHQQRKNEPRLEAQSTSSSSTATIFLPSLIGSSDDGSSSARRAILIDSDLEPSSEPPAAGDTIASSHGNVRPNTSSAEQPSALCPIPAQLAASSPAASVKTNDCDRLGRKPIQDLNQRQSPHLGLDQSSEATEMNTFHSDGGKYRRDYGDKFELRESCLPAGEKKLCQNRPIIGQIRDGDRKRELMLQQQQQQQFQAGGRPGNDDGLMTSGKTICAADEPACARKEEFSIDFDDITLPSSPAPFSGGCLAMIDSGTILDDEEGVPPVRT
ncbi:uncharacterized protein LOC129721481 [Wyeomyia smithii]|uniref:uncharacterized protein LOC129721481 n=1 Tax=Wyeomyia smithii TaxID=174621 RepID=UPI002467C50A|nr:uncharacterized protein LOC129721481 [Wyeomyia smithii]